MIRKLLKGCIDSFLCNSLNPLRFQLAAMKPLSKVSNDYLLVKLKHEAHLLEKNIKTHYKKHHGIERKKYIIKLLAECRKREISQIEILNWADKILEAFSLWEYQKKPQMILGKNKITDDHPLSVPTVRFWSQNKPERNLILECLRVAQFAPASCNRQAFKIVIQENYAPDVAHASALNSSMFNAAPYRLFIYYNRNNYIEKYSAAIDVGMFSQNFIVEANKNGLGCCCCYASEHLEKSQNMYRKEFALSDEYYCLLTILVGEANEVVSKPPRVSVDNLIHNYIK